MITKSKKDIKYGKVEIHPDEFDPKNVKIRITTMIDENVLKGLKDISEEKNMGYQTLVNEVLKQFVENSHKKSAVLDEQKVRLIVREELKKKKTGND